MKARKISESSCPHCGNVVQFTEWNMVDSDLNLEETYLLTNGSFFKHKCPECGKEFDIYHSLNFNDPRSKTLVRYVMKDDLDNKNRKGISHMLLGDDGAPDYTIDVVFDPASFINCVRRTRFEFISGEENTVSAAEV